MFANFQKIKVPIVAIGGLQLKMVLFLLKMERIFSMCRCLFKDNNGFNSARELNLLFERVMNNEDLFSQAKEVLVGGSTHGSLLSKYGRLAHL